MSNAITTKHKTQPGVVASNQNDKLNSSIYEMLAMHNYCALADLEELVASDSEALAKCAECNMMCVVKTVMQIHMELTYSTIMQKLYSPNLLDKS